ncbi:uncharacterized protein FA14DRAFT_161811 [Meira miltonrushii]|uniref:Uncharacterized protein n=1 Tax=Meira miltonrushii TaxID=1280837 RepID=A0A316VAB7_9BASI|nr:uncharacterized protein FA14DRAFT_161811 [Meira miltonrushii]PWN34412.1 hypothetical protein FA14DRAFT_161811 [Meira miltonrushii]
MAPLRHFLFDLFLFVEALPLTAVNFTSAYMNAIRKKKKVLMKCIQYVAAHNFKKVRN